MEWIRINYFSVIMLGSFFLLIGIAALYDGFRAIKKGEIIATSPKDVTPNDIFATAAGIPPGNIKKYTGQEAVRVGKINIMMGIGLIFLSLISFLLLFYANSQSPINW